MEEDRKESDWPDFDDDHDDIFDEPSLSASEQPKKESVPHTTVFGEKEEGKKEWKPAEPTGESRSDFKSQIGKEPREKVREAHKSKSSNEWFWKATTVVLILLLAFFVFRGGDETSEITGKAVDIPSPIPVEAAPTLPPVADVDVDDDAILGEEDAPVTIIEFSDYQCPYCGRHFTQTVSQIRTNYIDNGKVRYVFRDFPLSFHPEAEPAGIAANCAGEQGKYFEYHDKLFENQGSLGTESYKTWAEEIGLDVAAWKECLSDPEQLAEIRNDFQDGRAAGVSGTPAFFINGKLISGAQPYEVFEQLIEAELS